MVRLDKLGSYQALAFKLFSSMARHLVFRPRGCEFEAHRDELNILSDFNM